MINSLIINTLKPVGVPVEFHKYDNITPPYITFFEYNQNAALRGDDKELVTGHYIHVDIFAKYNYKTIVKQVKELMINVGFERTFETEIYEDGADYYHKVIRFSYGKEREEF